MNRFEAHEMATAQRPWPKELVDSVREQMAARKIDANETAPMPALDLETALRHESGLRRIPQSDPPAPPPDLAIPMFVELPARRLPIALLVVLFALTLAAGFVLGRVTV